MVSAPTRRAFLSAGVLTFAVRPATPQENAVFSSDVKVVNVLASVRTKSGSIVANLTKDDFLLSEDNRPQSIKYFSREGSLPLVLGLLVDTSASQHNILKEEAAASFGFIERVLREGIDKTFLAHFDYRQELLMGLTTSKNNLRKALDNLKIPDQDHGTALYDAIYVAANEAMKKQSGRKAIIILTDGLDEGSHFTLAEAVKCAQQADTVIYSIMFRGDYDVYERNFHDTQRELDAMANREGKKKVILDLLYQRGYRILREISDKTGGGYFEVSNKMSLDVIYQRIEEELRGQYSIGYSPDRPAENNSYRTIELKTRRKDLVVQARPGYYSQAE